MCEHLADFYLGITYFLRWTHIMAGIVWIGILYFFNFVNIPFQAGIGPELAPKVNPQLMPRALWWFRWGAMWTWGIGLTLLIYKYTCGYLWAADGAMTGRAVWILWGAVFGTTMWFNVWFLIWPAQKKLLSGTAGDQAAALKARAGKFSRMNTYLSAPMLFCMIAPNNLGYFTYFSFTQVSFVLVCVVGFGIIKMLYTISKKISTTV